MILRLPQVRYRWPSLAFQWGYYIQPVYGWYQVLQTTTVTTMTHIPVLNVVGYA